MTRRKEGREIMVIEPTKTFSWGAPAQSAEEVFSYKDLERLPKPVQRYFIHVLMEGQNYIKSARIEQAGLFRLRPGTKHGRPFSAYQKVTTDRPGFVWNARIKLAPFVSLSVTDTYFKRQASMTAKLFSRVKVIDEYGSHELNAGALMRYLAEAVWYPTALLPGKHVSWSEVDHDCAAVTLRDGKLAVSGMFFFNRHDEITKFVTFERFRKQRRGYRKEKFVAKYDAYREFAGVKIPTSGAVAWCPLEGEFTYAQVGIQKIRFRI